MNPKRSKRLRFMVATIVFGVVGGLTYLVVLMAVVLFSVTRLPFALTFNLPIVTFFAVFNGCIVASWLWARLRQRLLLEEQP